MYLLLSQKLKKDKFYQTLKSDEFDWLWPNPFQDLTVEKNSHQKDHIKSFKFIIYESKRNKAYWEAIFAHRFIQILTKVIKKVCTLSN